MRPNAGYSKGQRRRLRELAALAYKNELEGHLEKLWGEFRRWKAGEIDPWELEEAVHRFHNGAARQLYGIYRDLDDDILVGAALAKGNLSREEVGEELFALLESIIKIYR